MRTLRRTRAATVAALPAVLALAACGGGGENGEGSGQGATVVKVAETQGTPSAFVQFGVDKGFFREKGLDVQVSPGAGGAANVPKLVSGDVEFAGSNAVSVLLARTKGLPLTMVASGTSGTDSTEHGYQSVMVAAGSDIRSLDELSGKTVALNTLDNIDELLLKAALDRHGVDPARVELTEVPFPQMPAALETGDVDAARLIEPFATQAAQAGARFLPGGTAAAVKPRLQIGSYVTTSRYLADNPEVVKRFVAAVEATATAVDEDPQAFRDFLMTYADMPEGVANEIVLPAWQGSVDPQSLDLLASLMPKYGISDVKPRVADVVADVTEGAGR